MKKLVVVLLMALLMISSYVMGATSVLHSDGWINHERQEFVLEWMNNLWVWDITEE